MFQRARTYAWCVAIYVACQVGCDRLIPNPPGARQPGGATLSNDQSEPAAGQTAQPAEPGVGKYSRNLARDGLLITPVRTIFTADEKMVFDIQIPKAMQIYKALNDGHALQSHDEFMEKIIRENHIRLPKLLDGHTYEYDTEQEKLTVR